MESKRDNQEFQQFLGVENPFNGAKGQISKSIIMGTGKW